MALDQIKVVLQSPLYGGNVGSVCRAMMNMGLTQLVISEPAHEMNMHELLQMAHHADALYRNRVEAASLQEAVADCGLVAGTSARLGLYRSHSRTVRDWAPEILAASERTPVAIVFGPEDRGLSNEELAICNAIIQIPSHPDYLSLNLSKAVMVVAYELFVASGTFEPSEEFSEQAGTDLRERMFEIWRESLLDIGFMKNDKADHMMMGLRRILSRGSLSENDVKILMGIARQAQWNAKELRRRETDTA